METKEIDKFIGFFNNIGVKYGRHRIFNGFPDHQNATDYISVLQSHFLFDKSGKFLGVLSDDMGYFESRKV